MKTGVSNNNKINHSDKFQIIESIVERNNNNSSPSVEIFSSNISNNNVYVDIADLDETETHSLMYSENAHQWGRKPFDDQLAYLENSSATSRSVHSASGNTKPLTHLITSQGFHFSRQKLSTTSPFT